MKTPAEIEAELEYVRPGGQRVRDGRTAATKLLGMNDGVFTDLEATPDITWFELYKNVYPVMASFTSASDPVIQELVGRITKALSAKAGPLSPNASDEEALLFAEALFNFMRCNISYESARGNVLDGLHQQHFKYARDVLRDKTGTRVNTSIFYASGLEAATDSEQYEDIVLFLPVDVLAKFPGLPRCTLIFQVICDGKFLVEDPPVKEVVPTRSR